MTAPVPADVLSRLKAVLGEGGWSEAEIDALVAAGAAAVERKLEVSA